MSRTPDFLVIGAQKAGTTTLFEDLRAHPEIWLADKEASHLLHASSASDYASRFRRTDGLVGEVSTEYAMLPEVDAATRAGAFAPSTKIVYLVREPISRTLSHHHHEFALGLAPPVFEDALRERSRLVDNSRYATQIEPWLERFGAEHVSVVRFEDYVSDRRGVVADLCRFIGVAPHSFDSESAHNVATEKVVAAEGWRRVARSGVYRRLARPLMSERVRRGAMKRVLPSAPPRPPAPSTATLAELVDLLQPEAQRLAALLGTDTWWDVERAARIIKGDSGG